jgi:hypothetical protein
MSKPPAHLYSDDGALYDTRVPQWHKQAPLRQNFMKTHREINSLADLKATLRAGEFTFPGAYPLYLIAGDGEALHFDCVRKNWREVVQAYGPNGSRDWRCVACDINYEDGSLYCAECNQHIQSAYAED